MAMPVTDDCNPAIAGAARRLRVASVSGSLQGYAQLAFDHGLDEAAHPITNHGFNRVEPIVEKIYSRISDRLRGIMLRGNALHADCAAARKESCTGQKISVGVAAPIPSL